jgi:hypothetical protein
MFFPIDMNPKGDFTTLDLESRKIETLYMEARKAT